MQFIGRMRLATDVPTLFAGSPPVCMKAFLIQLNDDRQFGLVPLVFAAEFPQRPGRGVTRMPLRVLVVFALFVMQCALASATHAEGVLKAALVPSLERVMRDAPPNPMSALKLFAARRECESFQIAVWREGGGLGDIDLELRSDHEWDLALFKEHYVEVRQPSLDPRGDNRPLGAGWYPDALIPIEGTLEDAQWTFTAANDGSGETTRLFWTDVCVAENARPGEFNLGIAVRSGGDETSLDVQVRVWDFALPLQPALNSLFRVAARDRAMNRSIVDVLLAHRLMPLHVAPTEQAELIEGSGLKSTGLSFWSGDDNVRCAMLPPPDVAEVRRELALQDDRLRIYNYSADEIDLCAYQPDLVKAWGRALHEAGVDNLITMMPEKELYDDGSGSGRSAVDIWVVLPNMYDEAGDRIREVLAKGDEVWSYNALVQDEYSPKWQIDFAPVNFRIQPGFLSQSLGLTGLLYWQVDLWTKAPWSDIQTYSGFPGEGMLVYPPWPGFSTRVAASMRLKWLRDGVDDYDYLALLAGLGCRFEAKAFVDPVARSWRRWTKDPQKLEQQRQRLGEYLESVTRGNGGCDPLSR